MSPITVGEAGATATLAKTDVIMINFVEVIYAVT